jgi:beta-phosphoglucomutase-like phosphatase (HAD superfamily)
MQSPGAERIGTVIFDMDGVLIDSEPVHQHNERQIFRELGIEVTEEEHKSYVGSSARDSWERLVQKHGIHKTVDDLLEMGRCRYLDQLLSGDGVSLCAGSIGLIELFERAGYGLLLASSATRKTIHTVLDHFGLKRHFSVIVSADDIRRSKPAPDPFLKAADLAGVDPGSCLVIEDSTNGVLAAKAAGMYCIGYQNPSGFHQDLSAADRVVHALTEVTLHMVRELESR